LPQNTAYLASTVHDSIFLFCKPEMAQEVGNKIGELLCIKDVTDSLGWKVPFGYDLDIQESFYKKEPWTPQFVEGEY